MTSTKDEWVLLQQKLREMGDTSSRLVTSPRLVGGAEGLRDLSETSELASARDEVERLRAATAHVLADVNETEEEEEVGEGAPSKQQQPQHHTQQHQVHAAHRRTRAVSTEEERERARLQREMSRLREERDRAREKLMYAMVARLDRIESHMRRSRERAAAEAEAEESTRYRHYDHWLGEPRAATTRGGLGVRASVFDVPPWRPSSSGSTHAAHTAAVHNARNGGRTLDDKLHAALMNLARVQRENEFL
jgi:hypothetical protein